MTADEVGDMIVEAVGGRRITGDASRKLLDQMMADARSDDKLSEDAKRVKERQLFYEMMSATLPEDMTDHFDQLIEGFGQVIVSINRKHNKVAVCIEKPHDDGSWKDFSMVWQGSMEQIRYPFTEENGWWQCGTVPFGGFSKKALPEDPEWFETWVCDQDWTTEDIKGHAETNWSLFKNFDGDTLRYDVEATLADREKTRQSMYKMLLDLADREGVIIADWDNMATP